MNLNLPEKFRNGPRRFYAYPLNFVGANILPASAGVVSLDIITQPNQITVFTHFGFVSDGRLLMQLVNSDLGGGMFQGPCPADAFLSLMDRPGEFPVPIAFEGQGVLTIQATNDHGAIANNVRMAFIGYRIFPTSGPC